MKVIPQYKVIGPYNYDRIIHNIIMIPNGTIHFMHIIKDPGATTAFWSLWCKDNVPHCRDRR